MDIAGYIDSYLDEVEWPARVIPRSELELAINLEAEIGRRWPRPIASRRGAAA